MTRIQALWQWQHLVSTHLPTLSRPQVTTLALWSFGIVITPCAGLTTVSAFVALVLGQREPTVRERLRYWYRKRIRKKFRIRKHTRRRYRRRETTVQTCFAPLLRWVLAWWHPDHNHCLP